VRQHRILIAIFAVLSSHLIFIPSAHAAACVSGKSTFTGNGTIGLSNVVYTVESFTAVVAGCTWTVPAGVVKVDALIIGGGGGGGVWVASGGGAGGMIDTSSLTVTPNSSISITVGGGGTGGFLNPANGALTNAIKGGDSSFNGIVVTGGGRGGSWNNAAGNGGSGGGGTGSTTNGTTVNSSYGNNGGLGIYAGNSDYSYPAGGGGGGGAVGGDVVLNIGVSGTSGSGGAGKTSTIIGSSVTYAGGGGGGCHGNSTYPCISGSGGSSIGGSGDGYVIGTRQNTVGGNGAINTGSGGGGAGGPNNPAYSGSFTGGNGGSGVVIVRYVSNLILNPALGSGRVNATTATYRAATAFTINAPVNGKATFYERNKVISTCKNKTAVAGGTITCTWKPSVRGKVSLRVDYYQTGSSTLLERSNFEVWVNNRTGSR
jgi:hypothetical protein